jgi:hypothetical protein
MTRHRYPTASLLGDYVRAGLGLAVTGGPIALVPVNAVVGAGFGALALVFLLFAGSTALRQFRIVVVDEQGIAVEGPFGLRLDWDRLDAVALRYFATKRGATGWMQLVLRAGWRRLALDSRIEGFEAIAARAAAAAERRGLALGEATRVNFAALAVAVAGARPGWFGSDSRQPSPLGEREGPAA